MEFRDGDTKRQKAAKPRKNNVELSEAFLELSKLYQSAPVFPEDIWKSYKYHKLAGRLQQLDFDILADPSTAISEIRKISGFGPSAIGFVKEYIATGKIRRIENQRNQPFRIAMRNMMNIWGVGRATVSNKLRSIHFAGS